MADLTYCNPLPVENYPHVRRQPTAISKGDHRSMADPTVLYHKGKWYMYPTYDLAYVSEDMVHWSHHPIEPRNIGDAPTAVVFRGKVYMAANQSSLFVGDSPLGPFHELGAFRLPDGTPLRVNDPMLFADDDGRLYLYWGLSDPGIFGAELDGDHPTQLICDPVRLLAFDPAHEWEWFGEYNQEPGRSSIEGSWMLKVNGRYYLTYVGPGTCFRTYSMGAYVSDEGPLSGFRYQKRNPILRTLHGMMKGPGHGCIVQAPDGQLWAYYTSIVCYADRFERRIGMDPAGIDENGELFVHGASDVPQWMPGQKERPELGNDVPVWPLTFGNPAFASSCAPGRDAIYAISDTLLDWWQPSQADESPTLTVALRGCYRVSSFRVIWRDVGINFEQGRLPGAFQYAVEGLTEGGWETLFDASRNETDINCAYHECTPKDVTEVRLRILGSPKGIEPGVLNFTAFGVYVRRTEGLK